MLLLVVGVVGFLLPCCVLLAIAIAVALAQRRVSLSLLAASSSLPVLLLLSLLRLLLFAFVSAASSWLPVTIRCYFVYSCLVFIVSERVSTCRRVLQSILGNAYA